MDSEQARHRVHPAFTWTDRCLEAAAAAGVVAIGVYAWLSYNDLPAQVPIHFDLAGNPDGYGSRSSIFFLPVIALVLYAIMTTVGFIKPWFWNIPFTVTRENARRIYTATARLMRIIKIEAVALVGLVLWLVVASAHAGHTRGAWLPLVGVALLVATVFVGLIRIGRSAREVPSSEPGRIAP